MRPDWLTSLAHAMPSRCAVCGSWPTQPLCGPCGERFGNEVARCRTCALPLPAGRTQCGACLHAPPPLASCHAAVSYAYPWSGLVARFKFQGEPAWAPLLAQRLAAAAGVAQALSAAERLLPMPLAPGRLASRGFNQAALLARALAPGKTDSKLLLRLRETSVQTDLDRAAREANVAGAFGVEPLRHAEVRGLRLMLVDDVMTSGASLHAAARALLAAGAASVSAVVFARTDEPH